MTLKTYPPPPRLPPTTSDVVVLQTRREARGGPYSIRYSEFLKLVDGNQIEKATFR